MRLKDTIKISFNGLRTHQSRSALTILGIFIGIAAIIIIMSMGQGTQDLILQQISGFGSELIVIKPGREPKGPMDIAGTLYSDSLTKHDVELLKNKSNVPELADIMPIIMVPGSVSYKGETYRPTIMGGSAEFWADAFNIYPEEGVFFNENDIRQSNNVVIIGSKVKTELFDTADAVGKYINVRDRKFRIVGIFPSKGQVSFMNFDEVAIIPYTTAQAYFSGSSFFHEIIVQAKSSEVVNRTVRDIELTMRESHNITDPEKDDFFVVTMQGAIKQIAIIMQALTVFLAVVVAVSLVVGGIGVMNIMLVSVTERTREIGLRKAVGATNKDILLQFLLEAMGLTLAGGAIGVAFGGLLSFVISIIASQAFNLSWPFTFPVSAALLGFGISALVGLAFGLYPARQAAKKNPIEALRYE